MTVLDIEPLDVVSVRDGRSFDAGGASLARAMWPPTPWTVLGAIRARFARALGADPAEYGGRGWSDTGTVPESVRGCIEVLGDPKDPPRFQIGPVLLAGPEGKVLFPAPLDLVAVNTGNETCAARLEPRPADPFREMGAAWSGPPRECVLFPPRTGRPGKGTPFQHLDDAQARAWLGGQCPTVEDPRKGEDPREEVVFSESRIGIAMDPDKGHVREGMFYQRKAFSLAEGWKIRVPMLAVPEGSDLGRLAGLGEVGGDRHAVRFETGELEWPKADVGNEAVLWFLSPVRPEDLTDDHLSGAGNAAVRVMAIASSRPVSIGGWQMWRGANRPRPMRRYHPAGTCVYVRGDARTLHGRSLAADAWERAAGFGVCLVGAWPRVST